MMEHENKSITKCCLCHQIPSKSNVCHTCSDLKKNKLRGPLITNTDEVNLSLTNSDMLLREDNSNNACSFPCINIFSADTSSQDLSKLIPLLCYQQCDNDIWPREKG